MAQATNASISTGQTGTQYRTQDNDRYAAGLTSHSGSSRPSYAVAGTVWNDTSGTPWVRKMFDGTDDITLGTINPTTNVFAPASALIAASNLSDLVSASTARTNLGLGNAAVLNAGTAANNLVQLDASAELNLPSVTNLQDGGELTSANNLMVQPLGVGLTSSFMFPWGNASGSYKCNGFQVGVTRGGLSVWGQNYANYCYGGIGAGIYYTGSAVPKYGDSITNPSWTEYDNNGGVAHYGAAAGTQGNTITPTTLAYFPLNLAPQLPYAYTATTATAANLNVDSAGNIKRSTSVASSKHDIETFEPDRALSIIKALRPVWYRSAIPEDNSSWSWYHFIAEEAASVDARCASWSPKIIEYVASKKEIGVDESGNNIYKDTMSPVFGEAIPDGINHNTIIAALVSVVQNNLAKISTLEERISAMSDR